MPALLLSRGWCATCLTDRDPIESQSVPTNRRWMSTGVLLGIPAAAAAGRTPGGDPDETFLTSRSRPGSLSRVRLVVRDQRAPRYRRGDAQREPPAPAPVHRQPGRYSEWVEPELRPVP